LRLTAHRQAAMTPNGQREERTRSTISIRTRADRSGRRRCKGDQTEASPRFSHPVFMGRSACRRTS